MIYDDEFLENLLEPEVLERTKQRATKEVNKLNVSDTFLVDNLIRCRFYMLLSNLRAEDEEVKNKYNIYKEEFERYLKLSTSGKHKSVKSIEIFRS